MAVAILNGAAGDRKAEQKAKTMPGFMNGNVMVERAAADTEKLNIGRRRLNLGRNVDKPPRAPCRCRPCRHRI